jgi:hypothetical protein
MNRRDKLPKDLEPLAAELRAAKTERGFEVVSHDRIVSVLMTIFPFDSQLVDTERRRVLIAAIGKLAESGPISRNSLEASIRREEAVALKEPLRAFLLASNLSITLFGRVRPARFSGGIALMRHLPRKILDGRADQDAGIAEKDRLVLNYMGVVTRVRARSPAHALELALNRLDFVRGVWNFAHVRPTIWQSTSDPTTPIARVRFSRIHTLHTPDGQLATSTFWFNPEYRKLSFTSLPDREWNRMQKMLRSVQQRIPRIQYREELERAFVHYGRALDATDMESAFLKLWSILEFISGAGGERYDTMLGRAAFLFQPDKVTSYVLEHLRYQRNEIAHLGTPQQELRSLVFQLKLFVEQMLAFHLSMGRHFESLDEAGRFMDLHQAAGALRRRVELIEKALKFRRQ